MKNKNKKLSATALAKTMALSRKELLGKMEGAGWIYRQDDSWQLTEKGKIKGGEYTSHPEYGEYIVWPELIASFDEAKTGTDVNAVRSCRQLGKKVELSGQTMNALFSELGWIKKALKGWNITEQGKTMGGLQKEDYRSGIPYVCWPEQILDNKAFSLSLKEIKGDLSHAIGLSTEKNDEIESFREKFPAKLRTADGHMVKSKAEMLIDNWLYMAEIVHAYERKLPIEEDVYCDFYIPTGKVYIEYWGYENDEKYQKRKEDKLKIYDKYGFSLIQLKDEDVKNLDDVLPRMLLKFGVQTY
ncbi:glycerol kinase [Endozoicomonas montiporae]|uniref:Glycerol kinase n=2 Tax=Endozoicomonas montiporae TaxID=1027273 RepID=A0A081N3G2_9GAMM|nr:glycerol kinase [Endozoicomonas montiporae]